MRMKRILFRNVVTNVSYIEALGCVSEIESVFTCRSVINSKFKIKVKF